MSIRILIVDDEEPFRRLLNKELGRKGFITETAEDGRAALKMLKETSFDVVLLDIMMPGMDGMSMLKKMRSDPASPAIVVITGKATVDTAVEAMKNGAYDYLTKPYKLEELIIIINRAYDQKTLRIENQLLQQELQRKEGGFEFIGKSRSHKDLLKFIDKISSTDSTVLVLGESGTGKELVANHIWKKSRRSNRPFIALNCSTFSETLMESEIFGHEKGAFTSAFKVKRGLVETAHGGTLFLDEIGEMPPGLQAKILRFLDSGEFRRVGGNKNLRADVRIIAASNRDLEKAIEKGDFRQDLYFRLNVLKMNMTPLRDRRDDIEPLATYFLDKFRSLYGKSVGGFDKSSMKMLHNYDWPGNVRELENVIERAVILCESDLITNDDFIIPSSSPGQVNEEIPRLKEIEKEHIKKVLERTGGNRSQASKLLGLDRKTLYLKLKKYGLEA
ncbi:MAG: sigma-54-dependent Fis family transcriptional regulator [Nitrospirota bacterium]|nr:MAG: sigma-54-dependent Fis family transcriptional regulator [Nitrospirota bacterium]